MILNQDYKILGKVLGVEFQHNVYSEQGDTEERVISGSAYMYTEGNYSCDCDKMFFAGYSEQELDCGDSISYEELWLVRKDGTKIDLLKEGWFKNEPS